MIELEKIRRRHNRVYGGKLIAQAYCDMGELIREMDRLLQRESDLLAACANHAERYRLLQGAYEDLKEG